MHDATQPPASQTEVASPWRTLKVLAVVLAIEAGIAGGWFGRWLLAIPGKRWTGLALVGIAAALWAHIDAHRRAYAAVRLSRPLVALQIASFGAACTGLHWLAAGGLAPGADAILPLAVALAALPATAALAVIAPNPALARQLLGSAALCGGCVVAAWTAGDLTRSFWEATGAATMRLVELLLTPLAGGPVVRSEPFVIGTDAFQVTIAPACSGFHGIGLVTVLLAGSLWWFRRDLRFPRAVLLVPLGAVLMWLANVVRITALILVGIWISPAIAIDGFHSVAGWIAFLVVGLGVIWTASRSPYFAVQTAARPGPHREDALPPGQTPPRPDGPAAAPACGMLPTSTCILPFLVLTAVTLLSGAFTSGFDRLYPLRVVAVAAVLWRLRHTLPWRDCRLSLEPLALGTVGFVVWMLLAPAGTQEAAAALDPRQLGQPWAVLWLLFRVAGSTVTVPIAEELFFRGFLTRRCIAADADAVPVGRFSWFSCVVSSVAFGLLHGDAWLAGVVAGLLFAAALYVRGRLFDAVVAHATTNALLSGTVIATGSWSDWG